MPSDHAGIAIAWWQLALVANAVISLAYLLIATLILLPTARTHMLRANKLATATGLIFLSCSLGHGLHALQPLLQMEGDGGAMQMNTWWLAVAHTLTAFVALYYLSLRRSYGRILRSAPLYQDLEQQRRLVALEELALADAARVAAEEQRDADAAMMQAIISNSQSLVYVKDLEGRYLLTNRAFEDSLGLAHGEMVGRTDVDLDPALAGLWRANDDEARQGLQEMEEFNDRPDGRHFFETAKFPLRDPHGNVYAICGVSLDVTARRQAAAKELERDAALAANAAKSTFLATMSHEIRTPMNAVIGMTDLLLGSDLDDRQRECVTTLRSSGDSLLALINDVLDFSKIESGDLTLEQTPFDLDSVAECTVDLVGPPATAKGLELLCELPPGGPQLVVGDPHRVRQIVANLLSNAVKFTERGEVLLQVTREPLGDHQVRVRVSVTDSGIGIAPETADRLFQCYSQVSAATTRLYGGSGLGLAISRRLAEAMGGRLDLVSTTSAGSTFVFEVTLDLAAEDPSAAADGPDQSGQAASGARWLGQRALVVDDHQTSLQLLERELTALGLECSTFTSALEALAAVRQGLRYDVGVLDLHMPELNGATLGAQLREVSAVAASPLVLLTSLGSEPTDAGGDFAALLSKPPRRAALAVTLDRLLGGQQPATAPRPDEPAGTQPSLRVLLAEDNVVNQRVATLMLERLGHRVDTVANGYDAVAAATGSSYDVVLMDVQMPDVDGLEATRRIRARRPDDRLPYIVAMTANAMEQDRRECLAAGMDDYLSKPVRISELRAVLVAAGGQQPPAGVEPTEPAVDVSILSALMSDLGEDDSASRHELVEAYLTEASGFMALLREMVDHGDYPAIRSVSHTWRSSSGLLGARRLEELLTSLESSAAERSSRCEQLSVKVEQEYGRVRELLQLAG